MSDQPIIPQDGRDVDPDQKRLEENQAIRHDIITHLITDSSGNKSIPIDSDTLNVVKGLLKDSDSSVFTKKRLSVDEVGAENDRRAAELLDQVLNRVPRIDRNAASVGSGPNLSRGQLPTFSLTEGETSQVGDVVDLDEILAHGRKVMKGIEED